MLSIAIIMFREIIEISLILSVVLAATRGIPGRSLWILGGFVLGAVGAGLVALFADAISAYAEGMGQEIFNAGIMFCAAACIGWTVIWMRRHAREMVENIKKIGAGVATGKLPRLSLTAIIGLAMLREGSEIVLFIYGMVVSGESAFSITGGAVLGTLLGGGLGALIYFGLLRVPVGQMLRVTGFVMILLVAGLAAQGFGFLGAAGYLGVWSTPMWDSSWLLSDGSFTGKVLHTLVGYSAQPSPIQIFVYILTVASLLAAVSVADKAISLKRAIAVTALPTMLALLLSPQPASALDTIHSPNLVGHELELEYNFSKAVDDDGTVNNGQEHEFEVAYAFTDRWKTELAAELEKGPDDSADFEEMEIANFFQFWEQGEKFIDTGLQLAYAHNFRPHEGDAIEAKLLLEKSMGDFLHRANIGLEQGIGANTTGGPELSVLWSTRFRWMPALEPGFEIQSSLGQGSEISGSFNDQEHYAGPAAYGRLTHNIKYEAAYLAGLSDTSSDGAMRFKLEFEQFF